MALIPENERHRMQIAAGKLGRDRGHQFEKDLAAAIAATDWEGSDFNGHVNQHRVIGHPALEIVKYVATDLGLKTVDHVDAWWLGGLATSGLGDILHSPEGDMISRSKTDVLLSIHSNGKEYVKGISVKTCGKKTPTNDQLYFTTAVAFSELLRRNGIEWSEAAEMALRMFCGDKGFRPCDMNDVSDRLADPERWFFEELPNDGRQDIEKTLSNKQGDVSRVLLQLAYSDDPHPPEYVLHLTVKPESIDSADLALFSVDELIQFSNRHAGFFTKGYVIRKGRFKHDPAQHLAPRFGFVQFQRGGQKQHPTQLQFNLKAGYFNHLKE